MTESRHLSGPLSRSLAGDSKESAIVTEMTGPDLMTHEPDTERNLVARQASDLQRNVQNRIKRERARLLHDWTTAGGSEADFEEAWPSIHAQLGQIRVAEIGERARSRSLTAFRKRA